MERLSLAALPTLPSGVARPAYDPLRLTVGILHLGLGAFHRAHQAVYTDDVLAVDPRWGICGVSLKTPRAIEPLAAQDGLYTLLTKSGEGTVPRVIGALRETLFAGAARADLVDRFADPRIHIVSSTVTEKGYCHLPATGALDEAHPDIAHDLAHPEGPVSAVGIVVAGLAARRAAGGAPLTFVCCDNLPHNGRTVEGLVHAFAQRRDAALAAWIAANVAFPSTMVDRIVPATTDADIAETASLLGVHDAAPVAAEPFGQWIIEDRFAAPRPRWEDAGAQFTADVAPYEFMKLRLLNGSHSTLAYLGFLMGHDFVWQASRDPLLAALVERQIAMDGSQKLPQRLLGTVRDRLAANASYDHLALAVAGWIRYASGRDERDAPIEIQDPLAATYAQIVRDAHDDPARIADGFLDLQSVFGADLVAHGPFRNAVRGEVVALFRDGAARTLARHLGVAQSRA